MIKARVRTVFKGMVAVPDKHVLRAIDEGQQLWIQHDGQVMKIPHENILDIIVKRGELNTDKWNRVPYRLYYFNWNPYNPSQGSLID